MRFHYLGLKLLVVPLNRHCTSVEVMAMVRDLDVVVVALEGCGVKLSVDLTEAGLSIVDIII